MAATLALVAAFLFAVAATLQQKGALNLDGVSLANPMSLVRLVGQRMWLFGTVALLVGYVLQAGALDRGRLAVIQPLLVTTIVFALPLGWLLTNQRVGRTGSATRSPSRACSGSFSSRCRSVRDGSPHLSPRSQS